MTAFHLMLCSQAPKLCKVRYGYLYAVTRYALTLIGDKLVCKPFMPPRNRTLDKQRTYDNRRVLTDTDHRDYILGLPFCAVGSLLCSSCIVRSGGRIDRRARLCAQQLLCGTSAHRCSCVLITEHRVRGGDRVFPQTWYLQVSPNILTAAQRPPCGATPGS